MAKLPRKQSYPSGTPAVPTAYWDEFLDMWWTEDPQSYTMYHKSSLGKGGDMIRNLSWTAHTRKGGHRGTKRLYNAIFRRMGM